MKNRFASRFCADSLVGGSPGRSLRWISSSASSVPATLSLASEAMISGANPNRSAIRSALQPSALSSTVTG
ncbi:Uncharacterised protein [Mycobacteroides abscessus subsp. abscessus]|nr:Uncharacterised protein [Mycobacteroides abscessus subsp. abscessus]